MGYFGFSHIYAKGDKRRLVDPQTDQSTFEYRIKGEWDRTQNTFEMAETCKEQYCKGNYPWCGRYMVFKALERE